MKQKLLFIILPMLFLTTTMFAQWVNYCGNETPDNFTSPFTTSSASGAYTTTENGGVLTMTTGDGLDNGTGSLLWKQSSFSANDPLTVVVKAKANPDAIRNLAFVIDLDIAPYRFEVQIRNYSGVWNYNISKGSNPSTTPLGIDATEWHTYRFTKATDGTSSIYLDENPTPIYSSANTTSGTNTYFRFGDGWSSGTMNADFDWIVWDNTGAYSPTDLALPAFDASCAVLGINDLKSPVSTNIKAVGDRIYVSNVQKNTEVNVYSITGALVKSLKTNTDTNFSFKTGLWIATVKTDEGQKAVKLVVQ